MAGYLGQSHYVHHRCCRHSYGNQVEIVDWPVLDRQMKIYICNKQQLHWWWWWIARTELRKWVINTVSMTINHVDWQNEAGGTTL